MNVSFDLDSSRLVCTITDGALQATASAAHASEGAASLLAALEDARTHGLGECFWHEQEGDYRWLFCRHDDRVDVALMWCSGVITGWRHVFRADAVLEALAAKAKRDLERLAARTT